MQQTPVDKYEPDTTKWPATQFWSFDVAKEEWALLPMENTPPFQGLLTYAKAEDLLVLVGGGKDGGLQGSDSGGKYYRPSLSKQLWTCRADVKGTRNPVGFGREGNRYQTWYVVQTDETTHALFCPFKEMSEDSRLRFSPERARWVCTEHWHPSQVGRFEPDGHYLLEVPYADHRELQMDILKHGRHCQVLGPDALRAAVAEEARCLAAAYGVA